MRALKTPQRPSTARSSLLHRPRLRAKRAAPFLLLPHRSHILQNVIPPVSFVALIATAVTSYEYVVDMGGILPDYFPSISPNLAAQSFISNTSVALSLLLVFRTNSSYGRWDEARKMWGGLLNRSRDIMRQSATCFPGE